VCRRVPISGSQRHFWLPRSRKFALPAQDYALLPPSREPHQASTGGRSRRSPRRLEICVAPEIGCTEAAAIFYTLFETAKLQGLEPAFNLKTAAERSLAVPGTVTLPKDVL